MNQMSNEEPSTNEMMIGLAGLDLSTLKGWAEKISGEWNGDEHGIQEDRANCAQDIMKKADELKKLLDEMNELL